MFRPSPSRILYRLAFGLIVGLTTCYYAWTDVSSFRHIPRFGDGNSSYYSQLARGFKRGHLYLDAEVPAALIQAKNPYDPEQRPQGIAPHDVSYYHGRYYLYFGPAPVVTIFLPFYLLTGVEFPQPYAVLVFALLGYGALLGSFLFIRRRCFPEASGWTALVGLVVLSGATLIPAALLRRPQTWEVAVASGFFFVNASIALLLRSLRSSSGGKWAAAAGVALGLAVASRPTYLVAALMFVVPLRWGKARLAPPEGFTQRHAAAGLGACAAIISLLLAYNYARFGNAFEFGQRYQLTSIVEGNARHFGAAYWGGNFYLYLLAPLRWKNWFPFVKAAVGLKPAPGFYGEEYILGLIPNLPFCLFALVAVFRPWKTASNSPAIIRLNTFGVIAAGAASALLPLLFFYAACIRYMADFTPSLMLLAVCGLFELERIAPSKCWVRLIRGSAAFFAIFSCFTSAMEVVDLYDSSPEVYPAAYQPVARVVNRSIAEVLRVGGKSYGPIRLELAWTAPLIHPQEVLLRLDSGEGQSDLLLVQQVKPGVVRFGLSLKGQPTIFSGPIPTAGPKRHSLEVSLAEFYPSNEQGIVPGVLPYPAGWLMNWAVVRYDGAVAIETPQKQRSAEPARIEIDPKFSDQCSVVAHGGSEQMVGMPAIHVWHRVRFRLSPAMAGKAFPLAASGKEGAGDTLILRISANGEGRLIYDHWAAPILSSPTFTLGFNETHTLEFTIPAMDASARPTLEAKLDASPVWSTPVDAYPASWSELYDGQNAIESSWCEPLFPHGKFGALD